jgi:hypothetical protein
MNKSVILFNFFNKKAVLLIKKLILNKISHIYLEVLFIDLNYFLLDF